MIDILATNDLELLRDLLKQGEVDLALKIIEATLKSIDKRIKDMAKEAKDEPSRVEYPCQDE